MQPGMQPNAADTRAHPSALPSGEVPRFEVIFQVPATHRLLAVRSRSRGGLIRGIYWQHEEYNAGGRLVARYQSFEEISAAGETRSGWSKFDMAVIGGEQRLLPGVIRQAISDAKAGVDHTPSVR